MHWWRGSSAKFRSPNFSGGFFPTIAHERVNSGRNETPPSGSRIRKWVPRRHEPTPTGRLGRVFHRCVAASRPIAMALRDAGDGRFGDSSRLTIRY